MNVALCYLLNTLNLPVALSPDEAHGFGTIFKIWFYSKIAHPDVFPCYAYLGSVSTKCPSSFISSYFIRKKNLLDFFPLRDQTINISLLRYMHILKPLCVFTIEFFNNV